MRIPIVLLLTIFCTSIFGQTDDFKTLLNKGKEEFEKEDFRDQDYVKAVEYLEKAVEYSPENTEARYFLGYAYSRVNSKDGNGIINMRLSQTLKTSEQLETVNKLSPTYKGQMLILDPYSKLSSEWASLAMCYLYRNQADSAKWAFNEGKKRGGFTEFTLAISRKVLDACDQNTILITSGDNFTYPLWYLQIAEGYRKDITVICASLLSTTWYPGYLSRNKIVSFDLPDEILDTIEYCAWTDSIITMQNFSWMVKPTYAGKYLLRGDRIFLSLLRTNFGKDIYFTIAFNEDERLGLKDYLTPGPAVDKLRFDKPGGRYVNAEYENEMIEILKLSEYITLKSPDELRTLDYFRANVLAKASAYLMSNNRKNIQPLMDMLDQYASSEKFPYWQKAAKEYEDYLREQLRN